MTNKDRMMHQWELPLFRVAMGKSVQLVVSTQVGKKLRNV